MNKSRMVLSPAEGNTTTLLRDTVFEQYGGRCSVCGEGDKDVLTFTKLQPNGFKGTLHWLRRRGFPKDRELICANCLFKQKND